jgi:uncharacterized protein YegP (UPF0339 family)
MGNPIAKWQIFKDQNGVHWHFHLRHRNGNILLDSAEGYDSKGNARRALKRVQGYIPAMIEVVD